ncbi:hypothetical protein HPB49_012654 [Dermacentor silvarum]|uniref:Uncharacterized protein n=1 Tax=Dermacentor silvarum TaxID=543639 RepID=A0ACB8C9C3_DERSI|nr:hypothetical protein HPB49_012654 [Dermacentor silvarum]
MRRSYVQTTVAFVAPIPPLFRLTVGEQQALVNCHNERTRRSVLDVMAIERGVLTFGADGCVRYCEDCCLIKPDRGHHCSACRRCIPKMDHHCPWFNNCVCFSTYKFFLLTLFYVVALSLFGVFTTGKYVIDMWVTARMTPSTFHVTFLAVLGTGLALGLGAFLWHHVSMVFSNETTLEHMRAPIFRDTDDSFNVGCWQNFVQVFGPRMSLWMLPVFTSVGDGVRFPTKLHPVVGAQECEQRSVEATYSTGSSVVIFSMINKDTAKFLLLCLELIKLTESFVIVPDEDANRTTAELIASKGYPVEEYTITTEDHYTIAVQRIPAGRGGVQQLPRAKKTVAFLMTGLEGSSADFVVNMPHQSLGFILADHGYDVWLGNVRGTKYSNHAWLKKEGKDFWDFSIDEMAAYDLPAQLDWILEKTQQSSLQYVGWSQGCGIMFALLAEKPGYNDKEIGEIIFQGSMLGKHSDFINTIKQMSCNPVFPSISCQVAFFFVNRGFPVDINMLLPPKYNLRKVTTPVAIYWGDGDVLVTPRDVARLARSLPHVVLKYKTQLIASKGYPVEKYDIRTEDWYIITVHRIPAGRGDILGGNEGIKPVVLLMSGFEGCSADFVVNMPHQSLGFILADNGFDVWLGNVRGTKYSRHVFLNKIYRKFWDFSLDEMIKYDLPAQIDWILRQTKENTLQFVGWSQGGGIMFGLLADKPEYNKKSQLIASKGYPVEEHNVTTRDSYVLMMQRIPAGRAERSVQLHQKPAVILMSGLQGSSADYVVNMPDQSLGFMLADNGYDVWLANVRGTRYSSHLHLKKSSSGFWDFSLDEMISYDLPDQIDTVLNVTQQEALFYVGWSQGTAIMFGLLSSKPEYNQKILLFNAFAPVAFLGHMRAALQYLVPFSSPMNRFFQFIFNGAFLGKKGAILNGVKKLSCGSIIRGPFCTAGFYGINGGFPIEWNKTRLPVYMANVPSGTSVRNINHFAQSNRLQKYDWGRTRNVAKYGKPWPPAYNLRNVTTRVALYWGDGDVLATPRDVRDLYKKLPNVVLNYKVPVSGFTHLDFGWSIKAKDHLYKKMLGMMSAYSRTRQQVSSPKEVPEFL